MVSVSHLRARRARHQAQRGAAVFIVLMVIAILTAIGLFAVRSAGLADQAAGYDREGAQAALIAEYALTSTSAFMATTEADAVIQAYFNSENSDTPPICQSNALPAGYPMKPRPGCQRLSQTLIQSSITRATGESLFAPANLAGGPTGSTSSLNANETTSATFVVELTDLAKTGEAIPGYATKDTPLGMTVTAISQVRPTAACASGGGAPAAGQQVMRGMIKAGIAR